MSNRQGLEEGEYYELFIKVIGVGIAAFERYRQSIIRAINVKNKPTEKAEATLISQILKKPDKAQNLSADDVKTLARELKVAQEESETYKKEKKSAEKRYEYDVRILNVLATSGLKATSIAHEFKNDRNSVMVNYRFIIEALKGYGLWDILNSPEHTDKAYKNIPELLLNNKKINEKILVFLNTVLNETEKQRFASKSLNIAKLLDDIQKNWRRDYARLVFTLDIDEDLTADTSEDIFTVIFDNLILNTLQQNEDQPIINIIISIKKRRGRLEIFYCDDGRGLPSKYIADPMRILMVHETSKKNGHGLGMWIVNNTVLMTGGIINEIDGQGGFKIIFELGDKL